MTFFHAVSSSFVCFIELFAPVVIDESDHSGLGFITLIATLD